MGNTGSTGVSWWSAYEIAAKNFDPQHFPIAVNAAGVANVTAENAVIFNIGIIEKRGFDAFSVVCISLSANGYKDQIGQTTTAGMADSTQLQHGFSYSMHKSQLDSGVITIQVMNGATVVATQSIFVKSLLGTASKQKFFQHEVAWGGDNSPAVSVHNANCPTVKLGFELLSVGDGKVHMAKQPHFQDLELACVPGHALGRAGSEQRAWPWCMNAN